MHFGGAPEGRSRGAITAALALLIHRARLAAFPGEVEACCLFSLPERFVKSCHMEDNQLFFVFTPFFLTLISLTRWNVSQINLDLFLMSIWESPLKTFRKGRALSPELFTGDWVKLLSVTFKTGQ